MQIENRKVLLVVPSTNLVEQMFSDFCYDYGWKEAETCCTRIYSNSKDKLKKTELLQLKKLNLNESVMLKQLTISTWQSLQNWICTGPKNKKSFGRNMARMHTLQLA